MKRVAIITNIPSPYRVDLFFYLQTHYTEYEICIIYTAKNEDNRSWGVSDEKIINSTFLLSKVIKIKGSEDVRYIHIPSNVFSILSRLSPDVVIASEYNPASIQACLWSKWYKKPFIHWTDGTLHSERDISYFQKISRKFIVNNSSCAIASSSKSKEKLVAWGVPCHKIFVSLLTVNINDIIAKNNIYSIVPGRLLYVGRMTKCKGVDLLLDALTHVTKDVCLHIVGSDSYEEITYIKKQAKKLNVENKIVFIGFKQGNDLWKEYNEAQLFVMPSRNDCFGLVLVEALASRKVIIASKYADGAYDIIDDGRNGVIVDPYSRESFAQTIEHCLDNDSFCGYRPDILQKFTFDEVCREFVKAIEYVI